jgi:hypothetical protein
MDLITHLPCTARGHKAIAVHIVPTTDDVGALGCADISMTEIFRRRRRRNGSPENFVSDRDSRFTSEFFTAICRYFDIKQALLSTAYHPQTDGQTERKNRTLEEMLRHYVAPSQDDWPLKTPMREFAINNSIKVATGSILP